MEARCPHCQTRTTVEASQTRQAVQCKRCGKRFAIAPTIKAGEPSTQGDAQANSSAAGAMPKVIGGFTVRRELGAGAFGAVYLAHDSKLDRPVALKVPHPHTFGSSRAVERFEREARAAAALRLPDKASKDNPSEKSQCGDNHDKPQEPRLPTRPAEPPGQLRHLGGVVDGLVRELLDRLRRYVGV